MRALTPLIRSVLLVVTLTASAVLWAQPYGYSINSRGNFTDSSLVFALWRIDLATGEETYIGWTGQGDFTDIEGLAFDSEGRLFGIDDDHNTLVRIGTSTGNAVAVDGTVGNTGIPIGTNMDFGLTFTCNGEMLVTSAGTHELFRGDPETGRLEAIGSLGLPIVDMASVGDQVYGIGKGTDGNGNVAIPNLYRIDPDGPSAELIGPLGSEVSPYIQAGLAADEDGQLWAITDRNRVFGSNDTEAHPSEILRIDPATGQAEKVAETIVGIESLAIVPPASCDRNGGGGRGEPPVDDDGTPIPTLSDFGRWVLVMLMIGLALVRLRPAQS